MQRTEICFLLSWIADLECQIWNFILIGAFQVSYSWYGFETPTELDSWSVYRVDKAGGSKGGVEQKMKVVCLHTNNSWWTATDTEGKHCSLDSPVFNAKVQTGSLISSGGNHKSYNHGSIACTPAR